MSSLNRTQRIESHQASDSRHQSLVRSLTSQKNFHHHRREEHTWSLQIQNSRIPLLSPIREGLLVLAASDNGETLSTPNSKWPALEWISIGESPAGLRQARVYNSDSRRHLDIHVQYVDACDQQVLEGSSSKTVRRITTTCRGASHQYFYTHLVKAIFPLPYE